MTKGVMSASHRQKRSGLKGQRPNCLIICFKMKKSYRSGLCVCGVYPQRDKAVAVCEVFGIEVSFHYM